MLKGRVGLFFTRDRGGGVANVETKMGVDNPRRYSRGISFLGDLALPDGAGSINRVMTLGLRM